MKKKMLTIEELEKKMKAIGGVEVSEKEFNSSEEYKNIFDYVKKTFRANKAHKSAKLTKEKVST